MAGTAHSPFHSDVLAAYATALYRLGWRYERGRGTHRNPAEAFRCYSKAARLGSPDAVARLADAAIDDVVSAADLYYAGS